MTNATKDLEILALRSQLSILQQEITNHKIKKPSFTPAFRQLWVLIWQSWKTFFKNHSKGIWAMDFFVVPTLSFKVLYVLIIISWV